MSKEIWIVHCAAKAFRRAGIAFGQGANEVDPSVLSDAQLAAIEAEPQLKVEKPEAKDVTDGTTKQMKAWLEARGMEYPVNVKKDALIALIEQTRESESVAEVGDEAKTQAQ